jgi:endonuclease/exonuclease/phosphatase family metal-dependent hydrolase
VSTSTALSWTPATGATSYNVLFGTSNPPTSAPIGQTGATYQPQALAAATTYFWRVDAVGSGGVTEGIVWSFTTANAPPPSPPGAASNPLPSNGASGVATSATLNWSASAGATSYNVAFGTSNPPTSAPIGQTGTSYQPQALAAATTYFWRVDAVGCGGVTEGIVWSFTTATTPPPPPPPGAVSNPIPANAATGVATSATLGWTAGSGATGYDVNFGTNNPPPNVSLNQPATGYAPGALADATTYYWQVNARNGDVATPGPLWSFTTAAKPVSTGGDTTLRRLKMLTWNIQHGTDVNGVRAVDAQVALMVDLNVDIIGLQEVSIDSSEDLSRVYKAKLEALTGITWNSVWAPAPYPAGTNPEGVLILTRLPVASSAIAQWDVVPSDPAWLGTKRSGAMVEVIVNGRHVNVFVTHLDTDVNVRSAQLTQFLNWAQGFPAPRLLGGDFNMMPSEGDYTTATSKFRDTWAALINPFQSAPGPDPGYTKDKRTIAPWTGQPGRIDYWFHELTNTDARPSEVAVVHTARSDHHALLTSVTVK